MRNEPQDQTIAEPIEVEVIDEEGHLTPTNVMATLVYDSADPHAVCIEFDLPPRSTRWVFARDLLIEGCYEPVGEGDVQIFPSLDRRGSSVVALALRSHEGEAFFHLNARDAAEFIRRMLELVPLGAEDGSRSLDAALERILDGAPESETVRHDPQR